MHYGKGIAKNERKPNGRYPVYGANGELARTDKFLVEGDALIIGRKGSAGEVTRVSGKFWPADVTYYVVGNDQVDINYLFYVLKRIDLRQLATGIKPGINRNRVYELKISLPPLPEQKRMAAKIEELFENIDKAKKLREEAINETENLMPSALDEIFSEKRNKWEKREFVKCIERLSKQIKGIPKNEYEEKGKFPIIDQGEKFIGGYTNDESKSCRDKLPVILFGDHTRIFKYIDFPFAIGADGTKIIVPENVFVPKFFYYALQSLDIESLGYSRHYKILKKLQIPLPPEAKQKEIVTYLDDLQKKLITLKQLQSKTQKELDDLKKSILDKAFKGEL